jgi:hypothetical protein
MKIQYALWPVQHYVLLLSEHCINQEEAVLLKKGVVFSLINGMDNRLHTCHGKVPSKI